MTPEETIRNIKCAIGEVEWDYPINYAEAFEIAIKALEKHIPKKVYELFSTHAIFDSEGNYLDQLDIMTYKCPICNAVLASGDIDRNLCCSINYCEVCGQKLDWSGE